MFTKINREILRKTLMRSGIANKIDAVDCLKYCKEYLQNKYGHDFFQHAEPAYIKNNRLFIKVQSPLIVQEIKKNEQEIIDYLYNKTRNKIKRVCFIN